MYIGELDLIARDDVYMFERTTCCAYHPISLARIASISSYFIGQNRLDDVLCISTYFIGQNRLDDVLCISSYFIGQNRLDDVLCTSSYFIGQNRLEWT